MYKSAVIDVSKIDNNNKADTDYYNVCNCCGKGKNIYEVKLGYANQTTSTKMCKKCLCLLGDKIWDKI